MKKILLAALVTLASTQVFANTLTCITIGAESEATSKEISPNGFALLNFKSDKLSYTATAINGKIALLTLTDLATGTYSKADVNRNSANEIKLSLNQVVLYCKVAAE